LVRSAYFSSKFRELLPELIPNFFPNCSVRFGSKMFKFEFGSVRRFSKMHTSTAHSQFLLFHLCPPPKPTPLPVCLEPRDEKHVELQQDSTG
jgi:hypothetical protein